MYHSKVYMQKTLILINLMKLTGNRQSVGNRIAVKTETLFTISTIQSVIALFDLVSEITTN